MSIYGQGVSVVKEEQIEIPNFQPLFYHESVIPVFNQDDTFLVEENNINKMIESYKSIGESLTEEEAIQKLCLENKVEAISIIKELHTMYGSFDVNGDNEFVVETYIQEIDEAYNLMVIDQPKGSSSKDEEQDEKKKESRLKAFMKTVAEFFKKIKKAVVEAVNKIKVKIKEFINKYDLKDPKLVFEKLLFDNYGTMEITKLREKSGKDIFEVDFKIPSYIDSEYKSYLTDKSRDEIMDEMENYMNDSLSDIGIDKDNLIVSLQKSYFETKKVVLTGTELQSIDFERSLLETRVNLMLSSLNTALKTLKVGELRVKRSIDKLQKQNDVSLENIILANNFELKIIQFNMKLATLRGEACVKYQKNVYNTIAAINDRIREKHKKHATA